MAVCLPQYPKHYPRRSLECCFIMELCSGLHRHSLWLGCQGSMALRIVTFSCGSDCIFPLYNNSSEEAVIWVCEIAVFQVIYPGVCLSVIYLSIYLSSIYLSFYLSLYIYLSCIYYYLSIYYLSIIYLGV